jgi:hypothetical protein
MLLNKERVVQFCGAIMVIVKILGHRKNPVFTGVVGLGGKPTAHSSWNQISES